MYLEASFLMGKMMKKAYLTSPPFSTLKGKNSDSLDEEIAEKKNRLNGDN